MQAGNILFLLILSKTQWRQIVDIYIIVIIAQCANIDPLASRIPFNKSKLLLWHSVHRSTFLSHAPIHASFPAGRSMSCDSRHVLSLPILVLCSCWSHPTLEFVFSDCQRITHLLKCHLGSYMKSAWSLPLFHQKPCILFLNSCEILYFSAVSYQILQRCMHVLLHGKLSEGRNHIYILNSVVSTVWCGTGIY